MRLAGKTWTIQQLVYLLCEGIIGRHAQDEVPLAPMPMFVQRLARFLRLRAKQEPAGQHADPILKPQETVSRILALLGNGKANGKKEWKIPRKATFAKSKKATKKTVNFGAQGAAHKNKGVARRKSPKGKPMVLSRRLSRRIMKGTPMKSPIVACKLDFASSIKKQKVKKKRTGEAAATKKKEESGKPPRAP